MSIHIKSNSDINILLLVISPQALDYETTNSYTFNVQVRENLRVPADNVNSAVTTAQVNIRQQL